MEAIQLLNYIPAERLNFLAAETKVNYKSKKLDGITMFQLLLYSMVTVRRSSLRVMEEIFSSFQFQNIQLQAKHRSIKYNSISERLNTINPVFFEKLFEDCYTRFNHHFKNEKPNIIRFDSTLVSISSKLIDYGLRTGGTGNKKQLKFTIGLGSIIRSADFFYAPKYNNEDVALKEAILNNRFKNDEIVVFDRGIQARATYEELNARTILFVSRLKEDSGFKVIKKFKLNHVVTSPLKILDDCQVQLFNKKHHLTKSFLRLIIAIDEKTNKKLLFITNIKKMQAHEIAAIYKKRWQIEVFFKFLKQELNLSHLTSRSVNGIKVMFYMTLILAILLSVYKKMNHLKGYKIPRIKFSNELERNLIKQIVIISGGNPEKVPKLI